MNLTQAPPDADGTRPLLDTTRLLIAARVGDPAAQEYLFRRVYDCLRVMARQRLMRPGHGGEPFSALVNETWSTLIDQQRVGPDDRAYFFGLASRAMRRVLVDYAEARTASRRGSAARSALDAGQVAADERAFDFVELSASLEQLVGVDSRLGDIVTLRFFGGLSFDHIAEVTGRTVPVVKRDWLRARAWLYRSVQQAAEAGP
jgi:RNA polymerase sigma factor (TIGR02999 family)